MSKTFGMFSEILSKSCILTNVVEKTIIYRFPNRLFLNGVCPKIDRLYPKVEFPVSRGTPMISPLIKFDHEHNWNVPISNANKTTSFERKVTIDIGTEQFQHLAYHEIDGWYYLPSLDFETLLS